MSPKIFYAISFILFWQQSPAQSLGLNFGTMRILSSLEYPAPGISSVGYNTSTNFVDFGLSVPIRNFQIIYQYIKYDLPTGFGYSDFPKNYVGLYAVQIIRNDLGLGYKFQFWKNRIYLLPYAMLGIQNSLKTGDIYDDLIMIEYEPNYRKVGEATSNGYNFNQTTYNLALEIGFKIKYGLELGYRIKYVRASRTVQNLSVNYYYWQTGPEVNQLKAYSTGTGIFSSIFLKYNFGGLFEKVKNNRNSKEQIL